MSVKPWGKTGCLSLALLVVAVYLVLGARYLSYRESQIRRSEQCGHNIKTLAQAFRLYLADYDDRVMPDSRWSDSLVPYLSNQDVWACPNAQNKRCSYALSDGLSGASASGLQQPGRTVMLFESDAGWNSAGGSDLLPQEPRHGWHGDSLRWDWYAFADGHAEKLGRTRLPDGSWSKQPDADWVIWKPVLKETTPEGSEHER